MYDTFGIETPPRSTKWDEVRKGPTLEAVRRHVGKLATFPSARRG